MTNRNPGSTGERLTRKLASFTSRRSLLSKLGLALVVAPALPLLPVSRAAAQTPSLPIPPSARALDLSATDFTRKAQVTDPNVCSYWRYCAIDGTLCSCCGGGVSTCPAGTEPSPTSWVGTCVNPEDGKSYLIAYRDCCGSTVCQAGKDCSCDATDRELPIYRPQSNNDIIWCFGVSTMAYHCSTAALVGLAS